MLKAAPIDDEPVTDDDRNQIAEGWNAYRDNRMVSQEEATRACLEATEGASGRVEDQKTRD